MVRILRTSEAAEAKTKTTAAAAAAAAANSLLRGCSCGGQRQARLQRHQLEDIPSLKCQGKVGTLYDIERGADDAL